MAGWGRLARFALPVLLAGVPTLLNAQGSGPHAAEPITREMALVTFDSAWQRIQATHYDTAMRGVDWFAVRDSLRPRAAAARTLGALRSTIVVMLGTLGDSHFALIPREAADAVGADDRDGAPSGEPGDVGLDFRLLGAELVVTTVQTGSAAARAGIRTGWVLDSVGRFRAAAVRAVVRDHRVPRQQIAGMLRARAAAELQGPAGTSVTAVFRDQRGRRIAVELGRDPMRGMPVRYGNLPTMLVTVEHEVRPLAADGRCAGIIRFNVWMLPAMAQLDSAVDAMRHCDGIIVDLRGNPGGVGAMVMGFGGHFLDSTIALGILKSRTGTLRFIANPRRADIVHRPVAPISAPLAIVVDALSMSTSEIFAAGMQAVGRARIFGEATPGLALPAVLLRLPTGDILMHVMADFTDPNGVRVEGRGVIPDTMVPLTRRDLLGGRDAPLEAAVAWIEAGATRAMARQARE